MDVNKLYNENCIDTMSRMGEGFVDLTLTSPPYDNQRNYNGYSFDFETIAKELYRVTKDGGVVVWVVNDQTKDGSESGTSFKQALYFKEIGFNLHDTMIWVCQKAPLTHKRYEQAFEFMFVLVKGKIKTFNGLTTERKWKDNRTKKLVRVEKDGKKDYGYAGQSPNVLMNNVWSISTGGGKSTLDKIAYKHPAIFPEELAERHILSWSNPCDLVYDPFMGSGTTAKMAMLNGRFWIGSEISKEYCDIANERLQTLIN